MKRAFLNTPKGQIHYCLEGSGKPLLLLHPTPRSVDAYREVIPILSKSRRVIAMDNIGYGDSYKPQTPPSIEEYAKTVLLLLNALKIKKTSIVGHHTGALIGIEVAAAYPEYVDKLILSGPLYIDKKIGQLIKDMFKQWKVKEDGAHYMELWNHYRERVRTQIGCVSPSLTHRLVLDALRAGEISEYGHLAVANYIQMKERLHLIQCPTLVIWGTRDLLEFPIENRSKVDKTIHRSKVVEVKGGTSLIMQHMPDKFAQLVLDFLSNP